MEQRVRYEQVALLYRNSVTGYLVSVVVGALMIVALSNQLPIAHLIIWYAGLLLVTGARYYLSYRYSLSSDEERRAASWETWFLWGTGCAGLAWGLSIIVLFPEESVIHQFFIALTLAGLVGGSVAIFSARYQAYLAFSLTILLPVILRFLYVNDAVHTVLAIMVLVYLAGMSMTSRNTEKAIKIALMLRFDNQDLTDQISIRRQTEEALRVSESRFRDFTESAADFYWELDDQYRFTDVSERFKRITGLPRESVIGKMCQEVFGKNCQPTDQLNTLLDRLENHAGFDNLELDWVNGESLKCQLQLSAKPLADEDGLFMGYRGVGRDVTEERRIAQLIKHQATHDDLTGLVNRREFMRRLENALEHTKQGGSSCTLCYMDLDQFKIVNDTVGHAAGDALLKEFSGLLHGRLRTRDTLSRVGGDEFALLLENCSLESAIQIAESLLATLGEFRFTWESKEFQIGASIGIVPLDSETETALQVLSHADLACYTAKELGRNRIHIYQSGDIELTRMEQEMSLVSKLQDALRDNLFQLYRQPIYRLENNQISHYEVLLRLEYSPSNLLLPRTFIPAAERYGIMQEIDRWVIARAIADYADRYGNSSAVSYSINLSGNSLNDPSLFDWIDKHLNQWRVLPKSICFEITETAAIRNLNQAKDLIQALKAKGCHFALDDFGSGLSSFAYVKYLPVDYLKIDGGFVRDMENDSTASAMVTAINEMGHALGIRTVAEHVESDSALLALREIEVDYVQGNTLGEPTLLYPSASV
ncbi:MAG: EAL domain-containing protein [Gammaproteobacteria bacterium]|nr:EAL domain-containing protein [Gammaproteobacteria bacterium]